MLGQFEFKNVMLIGSTSDLGIALVNSLPLTKDAEIFFVGRYEPEVLPTTLIKRKISFLKCDLEVPTDLYSLATRLEEFDEIDLAIVAAGHLPPENQEMNLQSVMHAFSVNAVGVVSILSILAEYMSRTRHGRIVLISSVATMRPRLRNFTYGASKSAADFFARGLQSRLRYTGVRVMVIRPGYVYTRMTKDFKPAPFATTIEVFCKVALHGIEKNKEVIYVPRKLQIIMNVFKLLPKRLSDALSK